MMPHPTTNHLIGDLRRQDLLAAVERERRAAGVSGPALPWRPSAFRALALVTLALGFRG